MVDASAPEFCVRMRWFRQTHLIPWLIRRFGESSVRALARRMGMHNASYQAWEKRSVPHLWKLEGALKKLGIARAEVWAAWLYSGQGEHPTSVEDAPAIGEGAVAEDSSNTNGLAILRKVSQGEVEPEDAWTTLLTLWKVGTLTGVTYSDEGGLDKVA